MKFVVLTLFLFSSSRAFNPYPPSKTAHFEGDAGPRAHVTPFLKKGLVREARDLALVTELTPNLTSYSGFFTVDEECDSNLYFWFFPSANDWTKDPVSIWLQGGPGSSSFFGLLTENGPYNLRLDGELELREYSWHRNSSIIFIDNPVGTGYSYTRSLSCYATNQNEVATNLVNALQQFFQLFPELAQNDFYITGESYAGKYVPSLAYAILTGDTGINLKGIAIGNGWTDPVNQQHYSDYTYQLGLVDASTRDQMASVEATIVDLINKELYYEANSNWNSLLNRFNLAAQVDIYNYIYVNEASADYDLFVQKEEIRRALHVGNATWHGTDGNVYTALYEDMPRSVRPWLEELLENYRVLIYNGQLDIIVGYPLTAAYLQKLNWSGAAIYQQASRDVWTVDGEIAGYAKSAKNFTEVLVRNAGHMVPTDQPKWAFDLYSKFITGKPIAS